MCLNRKRLVIGIMLCLTYLFGYWIGQRDKRINVYFTLPQNSYNLPIENFIPFLPVRNPGGDTNELVASGI